MKDSAIRGNRYPEIVANHYFLIAVLTKLIAFSRAPRLIATILLKNNLVLCLLKQLQLALKCRFVSVSIQTNDSDPPIHPPPNQPCMSQSSSSPPLSNPPPTPPSHPAPTTPSPCSRTTTTAPTPSAKSSCTLKKPPPASLLASPARAAHTL